MIVLVWKVLAALFVLCGIAAYLVGWGAHRTPILEPLVKPFGAALDLTDRHLGESMRKYLKNVAVEDFYLGFACIAVGEAPGPGSSLHENLPFIDAITI